MAIGKAESHARSVFVLSVSRHLRAANVTEVYAQAMRLLLFAANFLRHPHMLGSIVPSSRFLVNQVLSAIDWERARVIVEYGPGVGTFTDEILRRMHPEARLIAIEMNQSFVRFLCSSLQDPRLHVEHSSATDVRLVLRKLGYAGASYIISGIPLGSMPDPVRANIAATSRDALEPGGEFVVYQFTSRVLPVLQRTFRHVRQSVERRNLPPAKLFVCHDGPARAVHAEVSAATRLPDDPC